MEEYIKSFNHGTDPIDLSKLTPIYGEIRPIELHRKEDGSVDDAPSYCMVFVDAMGAHYYAQMSEVTLLSAIERSKPTTP